MECTTTMATTNEYNSYLPEYYSHLPKEIGTTDHGFVGATTTTISEDQLPQQQQQQQQQGQTEKRRLGHRLSKWRENRTNKNKRGSSSETKSDDDPAHHDGGNDNGDADGSSSSSVVNGNPGGVDDTTGDSDASSVSSEAVEDVERQRRWGWSRWRESRNKNNNNNNNGAETTTTSSSKQSDEEATTGGKVPSRDDVEETTVVSSRENTRTQEGTDDRSNGVSTSSDNATTWEETTEVAAATTTTSSSASKTTPEGTDDRSDGDVVAETAAAAPSSQPSSEQEAAAQAVVTLDDLLALEPRHLSISIFRDPLEIPARPLGLNLFECAHLGGVLVESIEKKNDNNNHNFLLPPDIPIKPGDILQSINGKRVCGGNNKNSNMKLADVLEILGNTTGLVKFTFLRQTTGGRGKQGSAAAAATTRSSPSDRGEKDDDDDCYRHAISRSIIVNPHQLKSFPIGLELAQTKADGNLRIKNISSISWLADTCLEEGQILLSLGGDPCFDLSVDDVEGFLRAKLEGPSSISISAYKPPPPSSKKRSKLRRTVVAVGGGTMVGVGAVIMATPLHPIGHAMAIGGVGVLGTEFEAPRKAVARAKKTVNNMKKNKKQKGRGGNNKQNNDGAAAAATDTDNE